MNALPVAPILGGAIALLSVNLPIYLVSQRGESAACRSARDFCVISLGFFLAATFALLDLLVQVGIDPSESIALAVLKIAGGGLALTTSAGWGFVWRLGCEPRP